MGNGNHFPQPLLLWPCDDGPPAAMRVYHWEVRFCCSAFVEMTSGKQRFCHLRREISPLRSAAVEMTKWQGGVSVICPFEMTVCCLLPPSSRAEGHGGMGIKISGAIETLSREISGRYAACHGRVGFCGSAFVEMTVGRRGIGGHHVLQPFWGDSISFVKMLPHSVTINI